MKKLMLYLLLSTLSTSCAIFPPPRVENGRFMHPEYEFSFAVPNGWTQPASTPAWVSAHVPNVIATFFNQETNGGIVVSVEKSLFSLREADPDPIKKNIDEYYARHAEDVRKSPLVTNYAFETFPPKFARWANNQRCIDLSLVAREQSLTKNEIVIIKSEVETYMYTCQEDDTCFLTIGLFSVDSQYDRNRQAYMAVLKSLRNGN